MTDNSFKKYRTYAVRYRNEPGFSLPYGEFLILRGIQECFYCTRIFQDTEHSLGIARIDRTIGYDIDNIVRCCSRCNFIRSSNFTHEEFIEISKVLVEKFNWKTIIRYPPPKRIDS